MTDEPPVGPPITGYAWRPGRPDDGAGLRGLLAACDRATGTGGTYAAGLPAAERVLAGHAGSDPARDLGCVEDAAGRLVAAAWARVPPGVRHQYRGLVFGAVHPTARRRGLGAGLVRWATARAGALLAALPDDREKVLRIGFPGARPDAVPVYERAGFRLHHVELELTRDLRTPLPDHPLPAGLALLDWTPARADRFYAACRAAFSTRPGPGGGWTRDEWVTGFTGDDSFRADLTRLAVAGETRTGAGYVVCDVRRVAGVPAGGVRQLGVVPAWRRRGIAAALLIGALRAFRAEGLGLAALEVNVNNPEARRLYDGLGFAEAGRFTVYTRPWHASPVAAERGGA